MDAFLSRISVLIADTSPKAVATREYILAILDGKVVIPDGIAMLMEELACDGHVNPEIDDIHFPGADAFVSTEGVVPVEIPMDPWTDLDAPVYLAAMTPPMRSVMPDKGLKWAAENKDVQRKTPLVILGQLCRASNGNVCALVLDGNNRRRSAFLFNVQVGFSRHFLVLAEPKKKTLGT